MKYSIVFKLKGALAEAVAVEWTDRADPRGSADGWEPCVRLRNGDWRIFSYGATDGWAAHWRDPGLFDNIGLRYRLAAAGPWSAVSEGRKAITIVAVAPAALAAADWTPLAPADAGGASGAFALTGAAAAAAAVEWSRADAADWQPCLDLGDGRWRPATTAGLAGEPLVLRHAFAADGPWSPASLDAKVLVTGLPFLPLMLAAPALAGTGRIGSEVSVDPGIWAGDPLPSLALQWRCDGVDIPGATGPTYRPGAAEDGRELACAVAANNLAGSATAVTAALAVTYAPPVARGALFEEIFDEDSGPQTVDAAADFVGENLSWSVAGAGATIDAAGLVTIPTDTPLAELVTVTATNSGGAATSAFMVTVEAPEVEVPVAPTAADWGLEAVSLAPDTHTGVFTLSPALGAVEVQWLGVNVANYATEAELEPHYNPTVALGGNRWRHDSPPGKSVHLRANGTSQAHIRMRYRIAADGPWSPYTEDRRTLDASLLPAEPPASAWSVMPFRTGAEAALGLRGGCQEQFWHGSARSKSNPALIIAGQDTGGTWFSEDDGRTWHKSQDGGLETFFMQGVAIDPVDANMWLGVGSEGPYGELEDRAGIYRSTDRGRSWTRTLTLSGVHHQRVPHNLCYDPTTEGAAAGKRIWYAPVHFRDNADGQVWRSTDGGASWTLRSRIPVSASGAAAQGHLSTIWHHPSQANALFLCTQAGLWKSTDGAATWIRMTGTGGLPNEEVVTIEINPGNGSEIYAVSNRAGSEAGSLWRTTNGGTSWSEVAIPAGFPASKVFVGCASGGGWQPVASRTLYLVGRGVSNPDGRLKVSHDGGASWFTAAVTGRPGDLGESAWANNISDGASGRPRPELCTRILPHPTNPDRAVAHAKAHIFRTADRGRTWSYSGEGFTGLIWGNFQAGVAFTSDPKRFAFGVTDAGMMLTKDGGRSFWHTRPHKAVDPAGGKLKDSMHSVALHPTEPDPIVASCGFMEPSSNTYLFRTAAADARTEASGDWTRVTDVSNHHNFLHWHKAAPSVVYANNLRSTNGGVSFAAYPSGIAGVAACWFADNDVIYAVNGKGVDTQILWSQDRGATRSVFVAVGWSVAAGDTRRNCIAVHPGDRNVVFTRSATGDLARYDRTTNRWKTDYDLIGLTRAANPGMPANYPVSINNAIAIDPQDPNCVYVAMVCPGYQTVWRTQNGQSDRPTWENVTFDLYKVSKGVLAVHPLTGDVFFGTNGIGACRVLPAPGKRSHPSLIGNWPAL